MTHTHDAGPREAPSPPIAGSADEQEAVEQYWTDHNVTLHRRFACSDESLRDFRWRNAQYYGYIDLMPVNHATGKAVLDFGCGPGYDLVGYATQSAPSRLVGVDVSRSSLAEAAARLQLHGAKPELLHLDIAKKPLPFADGTFDIVHTSGVLHHMPDAAPAFKELRRVLKPGGRFQVMVYHKASLWVHLYVAYERQLVQSIDGDLSIVDAFRKSTDGPDCPFSRYYTPGEFSALASGFGFRCERFQAAVSAWEVSLLPKRFMAIMDARLPEESRDFLAALRFDERGLPLGPDGIYAGIDGCYVFTAI